MYSVFAKDIRVIKKAGVYEEELLVENHFLVSIRLTFSIKPIQLPDYEKLVDIVLNEANKGFVWLEDWAEAILIGLKSNYSNCKVILLITKNNPAFAHKFVAGVGIEIETEI